MNGNKNRPAHILLVGDNPVDIRLTKEALKEDKMKMDLSVVMDGEGAIDFLNKNGKYRAALPPDLVL